MPKAGTGWLYDQLSHHPDFWMPPGKELHYLNQDSTKAKLFKRYLEDWDRTVRYGQRNGLTWGERELTFLRDIVSCVEKPMDIDRYAGLFRHKGNLLSGDISPGYGTLENERIREIAASLPETKIILLVREPVSRAWSRLCHAERAGQFDVSLLDDPAKFADFIRRSHHTRAFFATKIIRQWSRYYSDTQFRVILFDDIVQRSGETLREILNFVGADPSKAGTLPTDYNRKSRLRKLEMPDPIRKILAEHFDEEVRACSKLLRGAARAWPVLVAPPAIRFWWSFKRRVLSFFFGIKGPREGATRSRFTATRQSRSASHRLLTRNGRLLLFWVARHGRAMKRRTRQVIAFSRRLVRRATADIPVSELLIDAQSFVVNVLIRDCPVFLKRILRLPQRH
jgi:hypothetical protein